ncbi:putative F-box and leucine-rich repeat protein 2/20 [Monocercomonoides exilis]|uniref:putative F-box and leucine-rich repeat protein 2/20 n=1 Tax=Monocercomonoides exilis TaxID=2049356 RepID=UPI003559812B|nr:putative F-box and leucine-rich repeat protein 2/20 [Monocercomonoides exilis]
MSLFVIGKQHDKLRDGLIEQEDRENISKNSVYQLGVSQSQKSHDEAKTFTGIPTPSNTHFESTLKNEEDSSVIALSLSGTPPLPPPPMPSAPASAVVGLKHLQVLKIGWCSQITHEGISALSSNCKSLSALDLRCLDLSMENQSAATSVLPSTSLASQKPISPPPVPAALYPSSVVPPPPALPQADESAMYHTPTHSPSVSPTYPMPADFPEPLPTPSPPPPSSSLPSSVTSYSISASTSSSASSSSSSSSSPQPSICIPSTKPVLPPITSLNLSFCTGVTDSFIASLASSCPTLKKLKLKSCSSLTDAAVAALAVSCPCLESLSLEDCELIGDESIRLLARHCPNLTRLEMFGCERRNKGVMLHIAAEENNVGLLRFFLANGMSIDALSTDADGITPLMCACLSHAVQAANELLLRGANIHTRSTHSFNALMLACLAGHVPLVHLLLLNGAGPFTPDGRGLTPLICAARGGHSSVVQLLLDAGCSPNCATSQAIKAPLPRGLCVPSHITKNWMDMIDKPVGNTRAVPTPPPSVMSPALLTANLPLSPQSSPRNSSPNPMQSPMPSHSPMLSPNSANAGGTSSSSSSSFSSSSPSLPLFSSSPANACLPSPESHVTDPSAAASSLSASSLSGMLSQIAPLMPLAPLSVSSASDNTTLSSPTSSPTSSSSSASSFSLAHSNAANSLSPSSSPSSSSSTSTSTLTLSANSTPILAAVQSGNLSLLRLLLSHREISLSSPLKTGTNTLFGTLYSYPTHESAESSRNSSNNASSFAPSAPLSPTGTSSSSSSSHPWGVQNRNSTLHSSLSHTSLQPPLSSTASPQLPLAGSCSGQAIITDSFFLPVISLSLLLTQTLAQQTGTDELSPSINLLSSLNKYPAQFASLKQPPQTSSAPMKKSRSQTICPFHEAAPLVDVSESSSRSDFPSFSSSYLRETAHSRNASSASISVQSQVPQLSFTPPPPSSFSSSRRGTTVQPSTRKSIKRDISSSQIIFSSPGKAPSPSLPGIHPASAATSALQSPPKPVLFLSSHPLVHALLIEDAAAAVLLLFMGCDIPPEAGIDTALVNLSERFDANTQNVESNDVLVEGEKSEGEKKDKRVVLLFEATADLIQRLRQNDTSDLSLSDSASPDLTTLHPNKNKYILSLVTACASLRTEARRFFHSCLFGAADAVLSSLPCLLLHSVLLSRSVQSIFAESDAALAHLLSAPPSHSYSSSSHSKRTKQSQKEEDEQDASSPNHVEVHSLYEKHTHSDLSPFQHVFSVFHVLRMLRRGSDPYRIGERMWEMPETEALVALVEKWTDALTNVEAEGTVAEVCEEKDTIDWNETASNETELNSETVFLSIPAVFESSIFFTELLCDEVKAGEWKQVLTEREKVRENDDSKAAMILMRMIASDKKIDPITEKDQLESICAMLCVPPSLFIRMGIVTLRLLSFLSDEKAFSEESSNEVKVQRMKSITSHYERYINLQCIEMPDLPRSPIIIQVTQSALDMLQMDNFLQNVAVCTLPLLFHTIDLAKIIHVHLSYAKFITKCFVSSELLPSTMNSPSSLAEALMQSQRPNGIHTNQKHSLSIHEALLSISSDTSEMLQHLLADCNVLDLHYSTIPLSRMMKAALPCAHLMNLLSFSKQSGDIELEQDELINSEKPLSLSIFSPIDFLSSLSLTHLSLRGCALTSNQLSQLIASTALSSESRLINTLEYLDLSHNALTTVPSSICQFEHLKFLNLSFNPFLRSVPGSITRLPSLSLLVSVNNASTRATSKIASSSSFSLIHPKDPLLRLASEIKLLSIQSYAKDLKAQVEKELKEISKNYKEARKKAQKSERYAQYQLQRKNSRLARTASTNSATASEKKIDEPVKASELLDSQANTLPRKKLKRMSSSSSTSTDSSSSASTASLQLNSTYQIFDKNSSEIVSRSSYSQTNHRSEAKQSFTFGSRHLSKQYRPFKRFFLKYIEAIPMPASSSLSPFQHICPPFHVNLMLPDTFLTVLRMTHQLLLASSFPAPPIASYIAKASSQLNSILQKMLVSASGSVFFRDVERQLLATSEPNTVQTNSETNSSPNHFVSILQNFNPPPLFILRASQEEALDEWIHTTSEKILKMISTSALWKAFHSASPLEFSVCDGMARSPSEISLAPIVAEVITAVEMKRKAEPSSDAIDHPLPITPSPLSFIRVIALSDEGKTNGFSRNSSHSPLSSALFSALSQSTFNDAFNKVATPDNNVSLSNEDDAKPIVLASSHNSSVETFTLFNNPLPGQHTHILHIPSSLSFSRLFWLCLSFRSFVQTSEQTALFPSTISTFPTPILLSLSLSFDQLTFSDSTRCAIGNAPKASLPQSFVCSLFATLNSLHEIALAFGIRFIVYLIINVVMSEDHLSSEANELSTLHPPQPIRSYTMQIETEHTRSFEKRRKTEITRPLSLPVSSNSKVPFSKREIAEHKMVKHLSPVDDLDYVQLQGHLMKEELIENKNIMMITVDKEKEEDEINLPSSFWVSEVEDRNVYFMSKSTEMERSYTTVESDVQQKFDIVGSSKNESKLNPDEVVSPSKSTEVAECDVDASEARPPQGIQDDAVLISQSWYNVENENKSITNERQTEGGNNANFETNKEKSSGSDKGLVMVTKKDETSSSITVNEKVAQMTEAIVACISEWTDTICNDGELLLYAPMETLKKSHNQSKLDNSTEQVKDNTPVSSRLLQDTLSRETLNSQQMSSFEQNSHNSDKSFMSHDTNNNYHHISKFTHKSLGSATSLAGIQTFQDSLQILSSFPNGFGKMNTTQKNTFSENGTTQSYPSSTRSATSPPLNPVSSPIPPEFQPALLDSLDSLSLQVSSEPSPPFSQQHIPTPPHLPIPSPRLSPIPSPPLHPRTSSASASYHPTVASDQLRPSSVSNSLSHFTNMEQNSLNSASFPQGTNSPSPIVEFNRNNNFSYAPPRSLHPTVCSGFLSKSYKKQYSTKCCRISEESENQKDFLFTGNLPLFQGSFAGRRLTCSDNVSLTEENKKLHCQNETMDRTKPSMKCASCGSIQFVAGPPPLLAFQAAVREKKLQKAREKTPQIISSVLSFHPSDLHRTESMDVGPDLMDEYGSMEEVFEAVTKQVPSSSASDDHSVSHSEFNEHTNVSFAKLCQSEFQDVFHHPFWVVIHEKQTSSSSKKHPKNANDKLREVSNSTDQAVEKALQMQPDSMQQQESEECCALKPIASEPFGANVFLYSLHRLLSTFSLPATAQFLEPSHISLWNELWERSSALEHSEEQINMIQTMLKFMELCYPQKKKKLATEVTEDAKIIPLLLHGLQICYSYSEFKKLASSYGIKNSSLHSFIRSMSTWGIFAYLPRLTIPSSLHSFLIQHSITDLKQSELKGTIQSQVVVDSMWILNYLFAADKLYYTDDKSQKHMKKYLCEDDGLANSNNVLVLAFAYLRQFVERQIFGDVNKMCNEGADNCQHAHDFIDNLSSTVSEAHSYPLWLYAHLGLKPQDASYNCLWPSCSLVKDTDFLLKENKDETNIYKTEVSPANPSELNSENSTTVSPSIVKPCHNFSYAFGLKVESRSRIFITSADVSAIISTLLPSLTSFVRTAESKLNKQIATFKDKCEEENLNGIQPAVSFIVPWKASSHEPSNCGGVIGGFKSFLPISLNSKNLATISERTLEFVDVKGDSSLKDLKRSRSKKHEKKKKEKRQEKSEKMAKKQKTKKEKDADNLIEIPSEMEKKYTRYFPLIKAMSRLLNKSKTNKCFVSADGKVNYKRNSKNIDSFSQNIKNLGDIEAASLQNEVDKQSEQKIVVPFDLTFLIECNQKCRLPSEEKAQIVNITVAGHHPHFVDMVLVVLCNTVRCLLSKLTSSKDKNKSDGTAEFCCMTVQPNICIPPVNEDSTNSEGEATFYSLCNVALNKSSLPDLPKEIDLSFDFIRNDADADDDLESKPQKNTENNRRLKILPSHQYPDWETIHSLPFSRLPFIFTKTDHNSDTLRLISCSPLIDVMRYVREKYHSYCISSKLTSNRLQNLLSLLHTAAPEMTLGSSFDSFLTISELLKWWKLIEVSEQFASIDEKVNNSFVSTMSLDADHSMKASEDANAILKEESGQAHLSSRNSESLQVSDNIYSLKEAAYNPCLTHQKNFAKSKHGQMLSFFSSFSKWFSKSFLLFDPFAVDQKQEEPNPMELPSFIVCYLPHLDLHKMRSSSRSCSMSPLLSQYETFTEQNIEDSGSNLSDNTPSSPCLNIQNLPSYEAVTSTPLKTSVKSPKVNSHYLALLSRRVGLTVRLAGISMCDRSTISLQDYLSAAFFQSTLSHPCILHSSAVRALPSIHVNVERYALSCNAFLSQLTEMQQASTKKAKKLLHFSGDDQQFRVRYFKHLLPHPLASFPQESHHSLPLPRKRHISAGEMKPSLFADSDFDESPFQLFISPVVILKIALDICTALLYLHECSVPSIAHQAVFPSSIFFTINPLNYTLTNSLSSLYTPLAKLGGFYRARPLLMPRLKENAIETEGESKKKHQIEKQKTVKFSSAKLSEPQSMISTRSFSTSQSEGESSRSLLTELPLPPSSSVSPDFKISHSDYSNDSIKSLSSSPSPSISPYPSSMPKSSSSASLPPLPPPPRPLSPATVLSLSSETASSLPSSSSCSSFTHRASPVPPRPISALLTQTSFNESQTSLFSLDKDLSMATERLLEKDVSQLISFIDHLFVMSLPISPSLLNSIAPDLLSSTRFSLPSFLNFLIWPDDWELEDDVAATSLLSPGKNLCSSHPSSEKSVKNFSVQIELPVNDKSVLSNPRVTMKEFTSSCASQTNSSMALKS